MASLERFRARSQIDPQLSKVCHMDVRAMFWAISRLTCGGARAQEEDLRSLAPRLLLGSIVSKLKRKPEADWGPRAARAARQAAVRGLCAQDKFYKIGEAPTPTWQACGLE